MNQEAMSALTMILHFFTYPVGLKKQIQQQQKKNELQVYST